MLNIGSIFEYEYESMLIYLVIASTGIQNLMNAPEQFAPYASVTTIVPIELQHPVTRSAIARATGLARETVRRKVAAMIDSGLLTTDDRGRLFLTPGILSTSRITEATTASAAPTPASVRVST